MAKRTKEEKEQAKKLKSMNFKFSDFPHLLAIKPNEKYIFHSDYFEVDHGFATILGFFHIDGASDDYMPFWGIGRIPNGLENDIVVIGFEQIRRMTKSWIESHESLAESINSINTQEVNSSKSTKSMKQKNSKKAIELEEIARAIGSNAAYLQCHFKLMVKAPTLEKLDEALETIERRYNDLFSTLSAAAYMGEQRQELSTLFSKNDKKVGNPYYFTSVEFAGDFSLVTHGIEDKNGEYVGKMFGDVNNSAVLFAVNGYKHHIVCANEGVNVAFDRTPIVDFWGSKISQSCLIHNGRTVHIILDGCNLDMLGPDLDDITYKLNMNAGDLNMFEMFGQPHNELAIFSNQLEKLILMTEQAYQTTDADRSIIRNTLSEVLTKFYIQQKMWTENAKQNQRKIRIINIPHQDVPTLQLFQSYLEQEYTAQNRKAASGEGDPNLLHALLVLRGVFRNLLNANGDLFNTHTNNNIDGAVRGRRVIYDFSTLRHRGVGVAMAQLVNIIGFATGNLSTGDTIIIHGADKIDDGVKKYITDQFEMLYDKGGRVAFLYNSIDKMFYDTAFSHFDKADYTIIGTMTDAQVKKYQDTLSKTIPGDLARLVTTKEDTLAYLRRGNNNIIFTQDLLLGIKGKAKKGAQV